MWSGRFVPRLADDPCRGLQSALVILLLAGCRYDFGEVTGAGAPDAAAYDSAVDRLADETSGREDSNAGGGGGGGGDGADAPAEASGGTAGYTGVPKVLASNLPAPYHVAVDPNHAYVTMVGRLTSNAGGLARVPIGGGGIEVLSQPTIGMFLGLAIDASRVYVGFVDVESFVGATLILQFSKLPGAQPVALDNHVAPDHLATAIGAPEGESLVVYGDGRVVFAVPADGGDRREIAQSPARVSAVAVQGDVVFWTAYDDDALTGSVLRAPLVGGEAVTVIPGTRRPLGITADATHVYALDFEAGDVWRARGDGSGVEKLASGQDHPYSIVVDSDTVYWANRGSDLTYETCQGLGSIRALPKSGGPGRTIAGNLNCPSGLAVDTNAVYWTELGSAPLSATEDGTLMRLDR